MTSHFFQVDYGATCIISLHYSFLILIEFRIIENAHTPGTLLSRRLCLRLHERGVQSKLKPQLDSLGGG